MLYFWASWSGKRVHNNLNYYKQLFPTTIYPRVRKCEKEDGKYQLMIYKLIQRAELENYLVLSTKLRKINHAYH